MFDRVDQATAVTLGVTQAVTIWVTVCPTPSQLRASVPGAAGSDAVGELRHTELVAGVLAAAVGSTASLMTKSFAPLAATGVVVACLLAAYEYSLRRPSPLGRTTA